jgi:hypothetical protein
LSPSQPGYFSLSFPFPLSGLLLFSPSQPGYFPLSFPFPFPRFSLFLASRFDDFFPFAISPQLFCFPLFLLLFSIFLSSPFLFFLLPSFSFFLILLLLKPNDLLLLYSGFQLLYLLQSAYFSYFFPNLPLLHYL